MCRWAGISRMKLTRQMIRMRLKDSFPKLKKRIRTAGISGRNVTAIKRLSIKLFPVVGIMHVCEQCTGQRVKRSIDQIVLYGEENKSCRIFCTKAFHQPIFYCLYGPGAYVNLLSDLLGGEFHTDVPYDLPFTIVQCNFSI